MPRWLRTLVIVVTVMGLAYFLTQIPRPSTRPQTPAAPEDIERIEILNPNLDSPLLLQNEAGAWRVKIPLDAPTNDGAMSGLLGGLRSLTLEEVMSRRPESHGLFQVDDNSGIRVKVWGRGASTPLEWVIGKNSPAATHIYVRKGPEIEVYLARGLRRDQVEGGLQTWRETRVLPLPADQTITNLERRGPIGRLTLDRSTSTWTVNGKAGDQIKIENLLNALRYLSVEEFVDPPIPPSLSAGFKPATTLTLVLSSGTTHTLRVGPEQKGKAPRVLIQRDQDPSWMWVAARSLDLLTTTPKELQSR